MAKLKISTTTSVSSVNYPQSQTDRFVTPTLVNGNRIGGVGGATSQTGLQIRPTVFITGGSALPGSITAQKGAHKFRVSDGTRSGTCRLVNNTTLAAGQMNLFANICVIPSANIAAANIAGNATQTWVTWTSGTTIGPVATPRVGDYILGFTSANIGAAGAQVTAVVSATNVAVAITGNVSSSTFVLANTMTLVSRIDNKYIHDFTTNGTRDSTDGTVTYYTSGFNPTRFRYVLGGNAISASATITSGFARVISG
jgi:hypothetical protein